LEQLEERLVLSAVWTPQGPGPILQGAPVSMEPQGNPDVGSVAALLPDPHNANILYAGTTNGGIWKTSNATASVPTWTPLTDNQPTLAIGALAFSPLDDNTLFAATGNFGSGHWTDSSFVPGGNPAGVLKSTDGGQTWSLLGQAALSGQNLRQILPTPVTTPQGEIILVSAGGSIAQQTGSGGVFRSTDGGQTWTELSGSPSSGLPTGDDETLIEDPANPKVLYTAVIGKGVYQSSDAGQTWQRIDDNGPNPIPPAVVTSSINLKLALNASGTLFLLTSAESTPGKLGSPGISYVFYTTDRGQNWTAMDMLGEGTNRPINEDGFGELVLGLATDPTNPNVVYVTGSAAQSDPSLPSEGIVYRGDFTQASDQQWAVVVGPGANGTPPGGSGNHPTIPHSDSKALVFDAGGNLLLGDDGGVYRLVNPNAVAPTDRYWVSVNGTLQNNEMYSVAYDAIDHILVGGSQDNGMAIQPQPGQAAWNEGFFDDVPVVAVDNIGPNAVVYGTGNSFDLSRAVFSNQANTLTLVQLASSPGGPYQSGLISDDKTASGYIPFALNAVAPAQLMLGFHNLYESADRGDVITPLTLPSPKGVVSAIAYGGFSGGVANSGVAYVGTSDGKVFVRTTAGGAFTLAQTFDGPILSIALDPDDWHTAYVVVNNSQLNSEVWQTTNAGQTWSNVTGNLQQQALQVGSVVVVHPTPQTTALVVGALGAGLGANQGSVFATVGPINGVATSWGLLGAGLPDVMVSQVVYNAADDVLVAGTFGRGAWTLDHAAQAIRALTPPSPPSPPTPPPSPPPTATFPASVRQQLLLDVLLLPNFSDAQGQASLAQLFDAALVLAWRQSPSEAAPLLQQEARVLVDLAFGQIAAAIADANALAANPLYNAAIGYSLGLIEGELILIAFAASG
jgi:photosystem II stability/assembly factor-like uncharacterized protein